MPTAVELEEVRGHVAGVRRDQENHERVCAERYAGISTAQSELKADIKGVKKTISMGLFAGFSIIVGITGWSLKAQWDMQQDTNRSMMQMMTGAMKPPVIVPQAIVQPPAQVAAPQVEQP